MVGSGITRTRTLVTEVTMPTFIETITRDILSLGGVAGGLRFYHLNNLPSVLGTRARGDPSNPDLFAQHDNRVLFRQTSTVNSAPAKLGHYRRFFRVDRGAWGLLLRDGYGARSFRGRASVFLGVDVREIIRRKSERKSNKISYLQK